ncbi:MAG TPA: O-antigen ligase family protein [Solirubrobacterales bacterium]
MEQGAPSAAGPALRVSRPPAWIVALVVVIAYITLITDDTYLGPVPLKLFLVAAAIVAWWLQVGRRRALRDYQFAIPVVLFAIAIPVIWSLVGAAHAVGHDPAGLHGLTWTMQEASRFTYLLLYFPLLDARRLYGSRGVDVWLFPVLALCGVTILLFLSHYLIGHPGNTPSFLIFKGVFGYNPGGFRVFIGNQVLFVVATALLLAEVASQGPSRLRTGGLALLIACTYLSHTRGIWLGISIVCAGVLLTVLWREVDARRRRLIIRAASGAALLAVVIGVCMLFGAVPRPSFLGDTSAGLREQQAPKLWDAYKQNPVFGDGLGAVVRPRFVRDPAAPWSYELTYLQLLFQMGVLGLLAVLALPLAVVRRGLKEASTSELRALPLAGAMAILGILVASATNPYLLASFGMLCVAIGLSLVARADPARL